MGSADCAVGVGVDDRQHRGGLAARAGLAVVREQLPRLLPEIDPHQHLEGAPPRHERDLAADGLDAPVDRGDDVGVRGGVARAPHADVIRVDLRAQLGVRDRVLVVADLLPRVELEPRLAGSGVRRAEPAVVEHHARKAGVAGPPRSRRDASP